MQSDSILFFINADKEWRQREIYKTYQQINWKWHYATGNMLVSTMGAPDIVTVAYGQTLLASLVLMLFLSTTHARID